VQNSLYVQVFRSVLLYWQGYCTALQQRTSAKLCCVVQGIELRDFRRGSHLFSAGRPSRCVSAHTLVIFGLAIPDYKRLFITSSGVRVWPTLRRFPYVVQSPVNVTKIRTHVGPECNTKIRTLPSAGIFSGFFAEVLSLWADSSLIL